MASIDFNPEKDIPDLAGKVILITGGTSGVGLETIKCLLQHGPSEIIFTGRNKAAADTIIETHTTSHPNVKLSFLPCDLSSLQSVKSISTNLLSNLDRLDLLLCIAGIMAVPASLSVDGYEVQFATNHLGHALLIKHLLPLLEHTAKQPHSDVRILLTSSQASNPPMPPPEGIQFDRLHTPQPMIGGTWRRYGQSKLANVVYARALASRYPRITVASVHPGIAMTGIVRDVGWFNYCFVLATTMGRRRPANELAWNGVWAATGPREEVQSGAYYEPVGQRVEFAKGDKRGHEALEEVLWEWTQEELRKWM
ncbi:hypothetical protein AAFC00_000830 [Neodothiora populina]|uniref:Oxidoreductase n=1 Tax=Neodothiora populina TaxID=2781224 RepID=A0ABR3PLX7_9PEZI